MCKGMVFSILLLVLVGCLSWVFFILTPIRMNGRWRSGVISLTVTPTLLGHCQR